MKLFILLLLPLAIFAFEPHSITPYPVLGYSEVPFFDEFQKTNRHLLIWYPVAPGIAGVPSNSPWDVFFIEKDVEINSSKKRPVIALSHGYTGNPHQLSWLIRGLVHHGFIVISIQHNDLIEGKAHANHWQRARDISQIIDKFVTTAIAKAADLDKIGIAGYSLGGTTAIWIAGGRATKLQSLLPSSEYSSLAEFSRINEVLPTLNKEMMAKDWREPRVKAAFVMAPAWAWLFYWTKWH